MKKSGILYLLVASIVLLVSCRVHRTGIHNYWSFYKINTPGTIAVDEQGNELTPRRDTAREIYIVTKATNLPSVTSVVLNKHYYTPVISRVDSGKLYVGESLPDNKRVELNTGEKFSLWKISFGQPISDIVINNHQSPAQLYLEVKHKGKKRMLEIKSSTELVPELHY